MSLQSRQRDIFRVTYLYHRYKGIYGYRRLKAAYVKEYGIRINHKKVYRIMKKAGLKSIIRKRRKGFYNAAPLIKPNILGQDFKTDRINAKWTTDITNLYFDNKTIYLSVILDLCNREILSYEMSQKKDNHLVIGTIKEAVNKAKNIEGVILHSDQGSQYTTEYYSNLLKSYGIVQSMSRRGNCLDNAPVECFFSHLKCELIYTIKFQSKEHMINEVEKYINFYNQKRIQVKLKNLSPVSYRTQEIRTTNSH